MANNTGFYTLGSRSGSFVENKRNEAGALEYQGASNEIGIERQRALQDLSSSYEQTINNAYASYLAGQQSIANSNMGTGFKNKYLEMQRENLVSQIAQANQTSATVREEINTAANAAQKQVNAIKAEETANLDRALTLMSDYRDYVNSLQDAKGRGMYDEEQQGWDIKYLYNDLFNMDPKDYYEDSSKTTRGKSYAEWVHEQMTGTDSDNAFSNWLYYNQGLQNLGQMIERSKLETPYETRDREKKEALETLSNYEVSISKAEPHYFSNRGAPTISHYTIEGEKGNYGRDRKISVDKLDKDVLVELQKLRDSGNLKKGQVIKIKGDVYLINDKKLNELTKLKKI